MQSRARGGDDLRTATIDALYNDVDYTEPRDDPDFGLRGHDECACIEHVHAPTFAAWPWGHSATEWAANELAWLPRRVCEERELPSVAWSCAGQYADSDSDTDDSDREDAGGTEEEEHS